MGECFFWYRLTRVVPDKFHRAVKWLCVCVCVLSSELITFCYALVAIVGHHIICLALLQKSANSITCFSLSCVSEFTGNRSQFQSFQCCTAFIALILPGIVIRHCMCVCALLLDSVSVMLVCQTVSDICCCLMKSSCQGRQFNGNS